MDKPGDKRLSEHARNLKELESALNNLEAAEKEVRKISAQFADDGNKLVYINDARWISSAALTITNDLLTMQDLILKCALKGQAMPSKTPTLFEILYGKCSD